MRRLLIIGCGDVALRVVHRLAGRYRIFALTHSRSRRALLRAQGVTPMLGDLDDAASLHGLAGIAHDVLHCAPPERTSERDTRTTHLIAALAKGKSLPQQLVYISTSSVYGDCGGALVAETSPLHPDTLRARLRVDAESQLRAWGRRCRVSVRVLRVSGIYAANRLPLARLRSGMAALHADEDGYVNHVHADDLAGMVVAALRFGACGRVYNASDGDPCQRGEYFDLVADSFGLPRPPRIARAEAAARIPALALSYMSESRRLVNTRIKRELRLTLAYPTVRAGLAGMRATSAP